LIDLCQKLKTLRDRTLAEVGRVVVGMDHVTEQFLIALFAGGHVLLEGVPGVAKTTLSKTFGVCWEPSITAFSSPPTCCLPT
jgi:MoxR-like ATPase